MASIMITQLSEIDVSLAVNLLYLQKLSLAINRLMWKEWPDETAQKTRIESAVNASLQDPNVKAFKIVEGEAQHLIGLLVLTRRIPTYPEEQSKESSNDSTKPVVPPELRSEVLEEVTAAIEGISKNMAHIDRMEITALVIGQSMRGQGLGSKLMQKAFEAAETEHVPLVVGSEPASNTFFTKLGFKYIKHCDIDLSKYAPPHSGFGVFRLTKMMRSP